MCLNNEQGEKSLKMDFLKICLKFFFRIKQAGEIRQTELQNKSFDLGDENR